MVGFRDFSLNKCHKILIYKQINAAYLICLDLKLHYSVGFGTVMKHLYLVITNIHPDFITTHSIS